MVHRLQRNHRAHAIMVFLNDIAPSPTAHEVPPALVRGSSSWKDPQGAIRSFRESWACVFDTYPTYPSKRPGWRVIDPGPKHRNWPARHSDIPYGLYCCYQTWDEVPF
jgi:hypothetical protein